MSNLDQPHKETDMNNDHSLLNDSDFAALMEAELACNQDPDNDISKQRIWNTLQSHIESSASYTKQSKSYLSKPMYSIAVSLLIMAIFLPLFFLDTNTNTVINDIERSKGIESAINTNLSVYTLDKFGKLVLSNGQHKVGTTLLFKVHSSQNGVASIISSRNGSLSTNRILYTITQDKFGQLLSREKQVYGYMIEPTDKILQFCVIAMTDGPKLQSKLNNLSSTWAHLNANTCTTINVTDSLDSRI